MVERKESKRPPPVECISQIRKLILISLYNIIIAEIFNFVKFSEAEESDVSLGLAGVEPFASARPQVFRLRGFEASCAFSFSQLSIFII